MRPLRDCLLATLLSFSTAAAGNPAELREGAPVIDGHMATLESAALGESRQLFIRLPVDYGKDDRRHPVLYVLDGSPEVFRHAVATVWYLSSMAAKAPDHIVVAIPSTNRNRDLSIDRTPERFLDFLSSELIPAVEARYRTNHTRILSGQSFSTQFAAYVLVTQPGLFDGYVLSSLGLSSGNLTQLRSLAAEHKRDSDGRPPRLVFATRALGDPYDPDGQFANLGHLFLDEFCAREISGTLVAYRTYDPAGHVPFQGLHDGLWWIYGR